MTRLLDLLYWTLRVAITILIAALVVPVTMQILSRYTGLVPRYIWTEELARFCFIWVIMVGSMIAVRDDTHFDVDVLPQPTTARGFGIAKLVRHLAMAVLAAAFLWYGRPFVNQGLMQTSEIAELPMVTIYIAWPLAGAVWLLFLAEKVVNDIRHIRMGAVPVPPWDPIRRSADLEQVEHVDVPAEVAAILFGTFVVLIVLRVPVAFALGLACVPVFFFSDRLTPSLLFDQMFKSYNSFLLLAVPFFLLAANLMNSAGITQRLINLSRVAVGHLPGGLGHINVVVSMLFAGISGSSTADAAGIGSLLIPQMKKEGYDARFSVAITACSSVMGVIIPPSILMVVWGGLMSVSIGGLFLAGILPGILLGLSMMAVVYVYAIRRNYPVYPRATMGEFGRAVRSAVLALATPAIILGGIVGGLFTPTEASVVAVLYSLVLGMIVYRTISLRRLPVVLYDSARFAAISLFCIGTASAFGWILAYYRIPQALVGVMAGWDVGVTGTGLIIALSFLFVGMFIDAIPAIIILGTVLSPVALEAGMHPIHFAIIGVVSLAFGLVTPPYGLCLLIASAIGEIRMVEALRDVAVILAAMLGVLLFIIVFPEAILALPRLVMPRFVG